MSVANLTNEQAKLMEYFWSQPETKELCLQDLMNDLSGCGFSKNTISHSLTNLSKMRLITARRKGRIIYYKARISKRSYRIGFNTQTKIRRYLGAPLNLISTALFAKDKPDKDELQDIDEWLERLLDELDD